MLLAERLALKDLDREPDWRVAEILNASAAENGTRRTDVGTRDAREILLSTGEWSAIVLLARATPSDQVPAAAVSEETRAALLALAERPMSWAEANGIKVDARAVGLARGGA